MKCVLFLLPLLLSFNVLSAEKTAKKTNEKETVTAPDSSKMDFGAKLLEQLVEAGFSTEQKSKAVDVLKNHRPAIKKICERLVAHIDAAEDGNLSEEDAEKQLVKIQVDLKSTNETIERDLLKIASNEQIVQLKLRQLDDKKKALAKTPDVDA